MSRCTRLCFSRHSWRAGLSPTILNYCWRDHLYGRDDKNGDDDRVIQMTKHRNEVGDEIKWQQGISHRQTEEPLRQLGGASVSKNELVNSQFLLEAVAE